MSTDRPPFRQHGVTMVELVMFILIVSVAVAGVLLVMNVTSKSSADPLIRKQALAVAESLLEEVELQSFTYCDPDDPAAATATGTGSCAVAQGLGPTPAMSYTDENGTTVNLAAETRYAEPRFDNVGDYNGFTMNGIRSLDGTAIGGLENYNATVTVSQEARNGIAAEDLLRIDVTVTAPGNETVTLTGYRFRYAPRAVP